MCSETSPRISFSQDLGQEDDASIEQVESRRDLSLLASNSDFEFSICSNFDHDSSLADELFLNGMILPVQVQDRVSASKQTQQHKHSTPLLSLPPPLHSSSENSRKESMKDVSLASTDLDAKPQSNNKSFWGFKRSSSLNCDIKRSLIRSLPLLSRSNSTGSGSNSKRTTSKDLQMQNQQKQQLTAKSSPSSSSAAAAAAAHVYPLLQKPPLKKNHGNRIRISPLLNVPPPSIPKGTASFLGFGFLYKDKKNKK